MTPSSSESRRMLARTLLLLALILAPAVAFAANEAPGSPAPSACGDIADHEQRLACYDGLVEQKKKAEPSAELSYFEKLWDLKPHADDKKRTFVLGPHRANYFLATAYNDSPNRHTALEYDSDAKAQYNEAKFQISFKAKALENILGQDIDFWVAYTQLSFWQVYYSAFSSPFRDTNYEPEALLNWRACYDIPGLQGLKLQFVNLGLNHQSNGRSEPLSRSWNRIVGTVGLEKGNFNLLLKTWYRIPEHEEDDDNPAISRYLGYGELWTTYFFKDTRFAVMLRNNLRDENRGAVQVDISVPLEKIWPRLGKKFALYVQYFNGYGECLLDYDDSANRIGAGFMVVDW